MLLLRSSNIFFLSKINISQHEYDLFELGSKKRFHLKATCATLNDSFYIAILKKQKNIFIWEHIFHNSWALLLLISFRVCKIAHYREILHWNCNYVGCCQQTLQLLCYWLQQQDATAWIIAPSYDNCSHFM